MEHQFFSETEQEEVALNSEEITSEVWYALVGVYKEFILNNAFSEAFPFNDGGYGVTNCDERALEIGIKANIPNIQTPVNYDKNQRIDKYTILDFLQYLYNNISDPYIHSEHPEFPLNIYKFNDTGNYKKKFRDKVNTILKRNKIVFYITIEGKIKRKIPKVFHSIIGQNFNTADEKLNKLLNIATSKFSETDFEERMIGLQNLWQAFERLKSLFDEDKRKSAEILVKKISDDCAKFEELIKDEFRNNLTKYGNNFQIRHFEKNKAEIKNSKHLDYFFYRMMAVINLSISELTE